MNWLRHSPEYSLGEAKYSCWQTSYRGLQFSDERMYLIRRQKFKKIIAEKEVDTFPDKFPGTFLPQISPLARLVQGSNVEYSI